MLVGAALIELRIHASRSLKTKRGVVRSITQRVRNRFNLSVAEVDGQDTWQRAVIGLAAAGADPRELRRVLDRAVDFIEELHLAEVTASDVELVHLPHEMSELPDDGRGDADELADAIDGDRDEES